MAKPTTIDEALAAAAINVTKSATEGDRSIEYKSIDELIKADQYINAKLAAVKPHFGLRFTKLVPPGGG